jgi:hypothetical protein
MEELAMLRTLAASLLILLAGASALRACPFCEAASPTWLQSVQQAEAAVAAKVVKVDLPAPGSPVPLASVHYEVTDVLRGDRDLKGRKVVLEELEAPPAGTLTLLTAVGAPDLSWSTLARMTQKRADYFAAAQRLPAGGQARWQFFFRYLEDVDDDLATDAYGEFAAASFAEVKAFAPQADRQRLWQWITSEKTPAARRGLYYTLLGARGEREDAVRLAAMIDDPDKRPPGAFSALVACYLSLTKKVGLKQIESLYLKGPIEREQDIQSVIVALRFHGDEQPAIERTRIAQSLRLLLDRPALAGQVIPDLARWEDWDSVPQMVRLFEIASGEDAWVRVPIVSYLKVCPRAEAKQALVRLKSIDAEAVEQAEALSLFGVGLRGRK